MALTGDPLNIIPPASQHVVAMPPVASATRQRHPNVRMIPQFDGGVDYRIMATVGYRRVGRALARSCKANFSQKSSLMPSLQRQVTRTRLHSQSASTHES